MTEPAPPRRLRAIAIGLVLAGVAVLLSLLLLEGAVRLLAPQQLVAGRPDVFMPRDSVGWQFRPGLSTTLNTGERTVTLLTDSAGLRVGGGGRSEGHTKLLLIGDSFLAALQVEEEQSLAGLLAAHLTDSLGAPVAVRNTGVPGWDPPQYLIRTRQMLAQEEFALVVVFVYVGNDVVPRRRDYIPPREPVPARPFRLPRAPTSGEVIDALFRPTNDALERHSHLFVLLKDRLRPLLMRVGLTAEYFPEEFLRSEAVSQRWDVTAQLLVDVVAAAHDRGVPTLLVLLPTPWQVAPKVFDEYVAGFGIDRAAVDHDQPHRLLGGRLTARGLQVIDPLDSLRARAASGDVLFVTIDRHFSPAGHAAVVRLIEPILREHLRPAPRRGVAGH